MPKKLKRHILNYIRFLMIYFIITTLVEIWHQFVGFEHYAFVEIGIVIFYFSVSAWFVWRAYTGMVRDLDFYDDDQIW